MFNSLKQSLLFTCDPRCDNIIPWSSLYSSQASSYNCEMSDLDQSELKENIHYSHTTDRDYWLFAWNPFDLTCRDKVTSQGAGSGGNRVDNGRRMDIFRESSGKELKRKKDCEW